MTQPFKYIFGKFSSPAKNSPNGYQVQKIDSNVTIDFKDNDINVYNSLELLIKNDKIFATLDKKTQKELIKEENIVYVKGFIFIKKDKIDDKNTLRFLQHTLFGEVYKRKALGIHHKTGLMKGVVELVRITKQSDKNGVYEVEIKRRDSRFIKNKEIKEWKTKQTTFFPDKWNLDDLYNECFFSFSNKIFERKIGKNILWTSKTLSEIPVEIFTDRDNIILSIYPIYTG